MLLQNVRNVLFAATILSSIPCFAKTPAKSLQKKGSQDVSADIVREEYTKIPIERVIPLTAETQRLHRSAGVTMKKQLENIGCRDVELRQEIKNANVVLSGRHEFRQEGLKLIGLWVSMMSSWATMPLFIHLAHKYLNIHQTSTAAALPSNGALATSVASYGGAAINLPLSALVTNHCISKSVDLANYRKKEKTLLLTGHAFCPAGAHFQEILEEK